MTRNDTPIGVTPPRPQERLNGKQHELRQIPQRNGGATNRNNSTFLRDLSTVRNVPNRGKRLTLIRLNCNGHHIRNNQVERRRGNVNPTALGLNNQITLNRVRRFNSLTPL